MKISDLRSLDFVINRFFLKLFKTNAIVLIQLKSAYIVLWIYDWKTKRRLFCHVTHVCQVSIHLHVL